MTEKQIDFCQIQEQDFSRTSNTLEKQNRGSSPEILAFSKLNQFLSHLQLLAPAQMQPGVKWQNLVSLNLNARNGENKSDFHYWLHITITFTFELRQSSLRGLRNC